MDVLQAKRIAVTGAFGALGAVVMRAVAAAGASAAGIARAPASNAPAQLRGFALFGGADISVAPVAETTLRAVAQKLGGLDALVNIAGAFRWGRVADNGPDIWELLHKANLLTAVNATRAALPLLSANGRIIYIGAAGAVKAGVGMLPSIIDTPANRADMPDADFLRWVRPEQIADLIVFLLSDRASAITGALIPIVGRV